MSTVSQLRQAGFFWIPVLVMIAAAAAAIGGTVYVLKGPKAKLAIQATLEQTETGGRTIVIAYNFRFNSLGAANRTTPVQIRCDAYDIGSARSDQLDTATLAHSGSLTIAVLGAQPTGSVTIECYEPATRAHAKTRLGLRQRAAPTDQPGGDLAFLGDLTSWPEETLCREIQTEKLTVTAGDGRLTGRCDLTYRREGDEGGYDHHVEFNLTGTFDAKTNAIGGSLDNGRLTSRYSHINPLSAYELAFGGTFEGSYDTKEQIVTGTSSITYRIVAYPGGLTEDADRYFAQQYRQPIVSKFVWVRK